MRKIRSGRASSADRRRWWCLPSGCARERAGVRVRDDRDRERFLEVLEGVAVRYRWRVLAYCLLGNHFHLLVMTLEPTLARGMRQLNGVYAQWFNRRHRRVGHLFQGRYKAVVVQTDAHLRRAVRYVIRNPIRAGLSSGPSNGAGRATTPRSADPRQGSWPSTRCLPASPITAMRLCAAIE